MAWRQPRRYLSWRTVHGTSAGPAKLTRGLSPPPSERASAGSAPTERAVDELIESRGLLPAALASGDPEERKRACARSGRGWFDDIPFEGRPRRSGEPRRPSNEESSTSFRPQTTSRTLEP